MALRRQRATDAEVRNRLLGQARLYARYATVADIADVDARRKRWNAIDAMGPRELRALAREYADDAQVRPAIRCVLDALDALDHDQQVSGRARD